MLRTKNKTRKINSMGQKQSKYHKEKRHGHKEQAHDHDKQIQQPQVEQEPLKKVQLDYSTTKYKWEINKEQMILIGKYFSLNINYINVMKVNKKYQDFVDEYETFPLTLY